MKWVAIAGSWRRTNEKVEKKVRKTVQEIISEGDGIVSGGALGVDYFALDEAMRLNSDCSQIRVFLPATLQVFKKHFFTRAQEGVISKDQAENLINQLTRLRKTNPKVLKETKGIKTVDKKAYFKRILKIIAAADQLIAFHINESEGVGYTINKAKQKGIPVKIFRYKI